MDASSTGPRCDRCGAAAKRTYIRGKATLDLCDHHAHQHHAALTRGGFVARRLDLPDLSPARAHPVNG